MDNLSIKGIESDTPRHRGKKRRGRKPFVIEARLVRDSKALRKALFGLGNWWVWGRYKSAFRRDQAFAALVKKETGIPGWSHWKFRKRDD